MKQKSITINAVLSAIKQIMTVLFPLITIPYISRILGAENYGKVNFGNSIIAYFTLLSGLGISTYAVLEGAKLREDKVKLGIFVNEVFSINLLTTLLSYVILGVILLFCNPIEQYKILLLVQAIPMLFITLGTDWINTIFEDYLYITLRYIIIQFVSLICIFLLVRSDADYIIYVSILGLTQVIGNLVNLFYIRKKYVTISFVSKMNFLKHIKPMLILFANNLAISIYVNADITFITIFNGDIAAGIYSVSVKIYTIVKQIIAGVISVLLPRVSFYLECKRFEEYDKLLQKAIHSLFIIIMPVIVGIFMLSNSIISIVGGAEYFAGANVVKILSFAIGAALFSNLLVYAVLIPNREESFVLKSTVIAALINVALNFIVIPRFSYMGAAVTTLLAEYFMLMITVNKCIKKYNVRFSIMKLLPCFEATISVFIVCGIGNNVFRNDIYKVIFCVVVSAFTYIVLVFLRRDVLITEIITCVIDKVRKNNDNK